MGDGKKREEDKQNAVVCGCGMWQRLLGQLTYFGRTSGHRGGSQGEEDMGSLRSIGQVPKKERKKKKEKKK